MINLKHDGYSQIRCVRRSDVPVPTAYINGRFVFTAPRMVSVTYKKKGR